MDRTRESIEALENYFEPDPRASGRRGVALSIGGCRMGQRMVPLDRGGKRRRERRPRDGAEGLKRMPEGFPNSDGRANCGDGEAADRRRGPESGVWVPNGSHLTWPCSVETDAEDARGNCGAQLPHFFSTGEGANARKGRTGMADRWQWNEGSERLDGDSAAPGFQRSWVRGRRTSW
jgi:hypothetical protein